jgi:hypothetical protein
MRTHTPGGAVLQLGGAMSRAAASLEGMVFYDSLKEGAASVARWGDQVGPGVFGSSAGGADFGQVSILGAEGYVEAIHPTVTYGVAGVWGNTNTLRQSVTVRFGPITLKWVPAVLAGANHGIYVDGVRLGDLFGGSTGFDYAFILVVMPGRLAAYRAGGLLFETLGTHPFSGNHLRIGYHNNELNNPSGGVGLENAWVSTGEVAIFAGVPAGFELRRSIVYPEDGTGTVTVNLAGVGYSATVWTWYDGPTPTGLSIGRVRPPGLGGGERLAWADRGEWGELWTGAGAL